jgi:hypothetical protein
MADDRSSWRGGYDGPEGRTRSNSPYGEEDRQRSSGQRDERGFFERAGEEVRSWFGDDQFDRNRERGNPGGGQSWGQDNQGSDWRGGSAGSGRGHYGAEHGFGGFQGDYGGGGGQGGFGGRGDWDGGRQSFSGGRSGHPMDHHYLSWRDRHIADLDRDYEEYCREHQQDFHSSFGNWRQQRQSRPQDGSQSHGVPGSSGELATGAAVTARPSDMAGGGATSGASGSTGSSADPAGAETSERSR